MLISAPVSATMPLIVLPPGPMSAPIFSGLILIVSMRGAYLRKFGTRFVDCAAHDLENFAARFLRAMDRFAENFVADPGQFQIELETGHALGRSAKFEIHVTEMIFGADDVGQKLVAFQLIVRRIRSRDRRKFPRPASLIGTPASISASIPPQTLAIEVEPFDSITSLEMRMA